MRLTKAQQEMKATLGDPENYADALILTIPLIDKHSALKLIRDYRKKWADAGIKRKPKAAPVGAGG